mmetsp:Transcript_15148/g.37126  ORF Transcript_15148/g.37126 Transcript_15148/m.37126 type:complete len:222 (-) Transcript_15148:57-722(-)
MRRDRVEAGRPPRHRERDPRPEAEAGAHPRDGRRRRRRARCSAVGAAGGVFRVPPPGLRPPEPRRAGLHHRGEAGPHGGPGGPRGGVPGHVRQPETARGEGSGRRRPPGSVADLQPGPAAAGPADNQAEPPDRHHRRRLHGPDRDGAEHDGDRRAGDREDRAGRLRRHRPEGVRGAGHLRGPQGGGRGAGGGAQRGRGDEPHHRRHPRGVRRRRGGGGANC